MLFQARGDVGIFPHQNPCYAASNSAICPSSLTKIPAMLLQTRRYVRLLLPKSLLCCSKLGDMSGFLLTKIPAMLFQTRGDVWISIKISLSLVLLASAGGAGAAGCVWGWINNCDIIINQISGYGLILVIG
jgi:hypothetical protein